MRILAGQTVVLTGASGGLGTYMARAFAGRKVKLALVAHPGIELEGLRKSIAAAGAEAVALTCDLRDPVQRRELLTIARKRFGPIDILVNNAGVEFNSAYHDLSEGQIGEVLSVNLEAPMILSRLALPEMLERRQGHIVNISSLAGKSGPAYQEPYAATKAGLVAFTQSLRATYRGSGVSASVIVPGFVEAGIYARLKVKRGQPAPALLRACPPEWVAAAVLRAIQRDLPEIIVNRYPVRPLLALTALAPSLGAWLSARTGANEFFRQIAAAEQRRQR
jgi:short-subunit dehydrogenase